MLYHPVLSEIRPIMARASRAWPQLHSRIEKAEQILLNFDIQFHGAPENTWQIASQTKADGTAKWYNVDVHGCDCMDFQAGRGRSGRRVFCKHSIAWHVYREILTDRMLSLLEEGTPFNGANIRRINRLREPIILQDGQHLHGAKYNGAALCIKYTYNTARRRRQFATDADMAEFADWLHAARPSLAAEAERQLFARMDTMQADAELLPFEDWRELHAQAAA